MPLHIKDQAATDQIRRLAHVQMTLTDAVRIACQEALEGDDRARPCQSVGRIYARPYRSAPRTSRRADKALNREGERRVTETLMVETSAREAIILEEPLGRPTRRANCRRKRFNRLLQRL